MIHCCPSHPCPYCHPWHCQPHGHWCSWCGQWVYSLYHACSLRPMQPYHTVTITAGDAAIDDARSFLYS